MKKQLKQVAKLNKLATSIGRRPNNFWLSVTNETLSFRDLKRCLECNGAELYIKFEGKEIKL